MGENTAFHWQKILRNESAEAAVSNAMWKEMVLPQLMDCVGGISETGGTVATQSCGVKREEDWGRRYSD